MTIQVVLPAGSTSRSESPVERTAREDVPTVADNANDLPGRFLPAALEPEGRQSADPDERRISARLTESRQSLVSDPTPRTLPDGGGPPEELADEVVHPLIVAPLTETELK